MGPAFLSELMDRVRARATLWSSPQDLDAAPADVKSGWAASRDPFAMLLLLAALHPEHDERACEAVVMKMSFFEPMRLEHERQARSRLGMLYNGPDRFRFLHVAQRVRNALARVDAKERADLEPKLCAAIRTVVSDPYQV